MAVEQFVNNGVILAENGTLVIDTGATQPDLDGDGRGDGIGYVSVLHGDLEIVSQGGAAYDVRLLVADGRELRMPNFTLALAANSTPEAPEASNHLRLSGGTVIGGGILQGEDSGPIEVQASPQTSRIESSADTVFAADVALEGDLQVEGDTFVTSTATLFGLGLLTVGPDGRLSMEPGVDPGVAIRNEGRFDVGGAQSTGTHEFDRFLDQADTGTLVIEFAEGGLVHDLIVASATCTIDGTLDLNSLDGSILEEEITLLRRPGDPGDVPAHRGAGGGDRGVHADGDSHSSGRRMPERHQRGRPRRRRGPAGADRRVGAVLRLPDGHRRRRHHRHGGPARTARNLGIVPGGVRPTG